MSADTRERVTAACEGLAWSEAPARDGLPCYEIAPEGVLAFVERLKERAGFETSTFVTAIDRAPSEPRFEVTWQFLSVTHGDRVRVRARVGLSDAEVPSITALYPGAAYGERECYDMFGVVFTGHAGLKRLLMPEEYEHFPLRKEFPHHGIEPDRLYREWERGRRAARS